MWEKINERIRQALQAIRLAFRVVTSATDSTTKVQLLQVQGLAGESLTGSEYFQHYGFTSNPPAGCMGIAVPLNGVTSHTVIVATEHGGYRLKSLQTGEVAIYTDEGCSIVLKRGRIIEVTCDDYRINCQTYSVNASASADFTTPQLTASAQVVAQGQISGNGGLSVRGGTGGASATFVGSVQQTGGEFITDGDVKAGAVSLKDHTHSGGNNGNNTGAPNA